MGESELERNKAVIRNHIDELWNKRNPAIIDEVFADDYVNDYGPTGRQNLTELKQWVIDFLRDLPPDTHITIEDQIAEGDKVLTRSTWHFTHSIPFMGVPPTGKRWEVHALDVHRLRDGKLVEAWGQTDVANVVEAMKAAAQTV